MCFLPFFLPAASRYLPHLSGHCLSLLLLQRRGPSEALHSLQSVIISTFRISFIVLRWRNLSLYLLLFFLTHYFFFGFFFALISQHTKYIVHWILLALFFGLFISMFHVIWNLVGTAALRRLSVDGGLMRQEAKEKRGKWMSRRKFSFSRN